MPRNKRKKVASEDRPETRKRPVPAGHEPSLDVNNFAPNTKAPFASETNIRDGSSEDLGMDHAELPVPVNLPQQESRNFDENKSDDDDRGAAKTSELLQNPQESGGQSAASTRKERIRGMVEHRKQLLHRVRQGRSLVEKRMASKHSPDESNEQEVARYLDMVKSVNSELRKQQAQQQQQATERRSLVRRDSAAAPKRSAAVALHNEDDLELSARSLATTRQPAPPKAKKTVICAETAALRERRNAIRSQLKMPPNEHPPPLPARRQTHWDTLLQEMAWAATDFREERKWKISAARWMGEEILRNRGSQGDTTDRPTEEEQMPVADKAEDLMMKVELINGENGETDHVPEAVSEPVDSSVESSVSDNDLKKIASRLSRNVISLLKANEDVVCSEHHVVVSPTRSDVLNGAHTTEPLENGFKPKSADEYVNRIIELIKEEPHFGRRSRSELYGQKLTETQVRAVQTIEDRWQRAHVGACLKGPVSTGKTIAVCSLLWRNRVQGAQLIICSIGSLVRWIHELSCFPELKPNVLEGSKLDEKMEQCNVLVCTHSAVLHLTTAQLRRFHTVVLDKRYPTGFNGSRVDVAKEDISSSAPSEFSNIAWWKKLSVSHSNRLVVEKSEESFGFLRNVSNRHRLSIMAIYMGFLLGAHVFETTKFPLEKSILAWGRQRIKRTGELSDSKYRRIHSLFSSICDSLNCRIQNRQSLEDAKEKDEWDTRQCQMPSAQAESYIRTCSDLRLVLGRSVPIAREGKEFEAMADALLQLRRQVFHSDLLNQCNSVRRLMSERVSSSQPDVEHARSLLSGSGKLQDLVSLLFQEFQCQFNGIASDLRPLLEDNRKQRSKSSTEISRLVILSSLPETLVVLSGLLSFIGIDHDLLTDNAEADWDPRESQFVLSDFNRLDHAKEESAATKVIVAPPHVVAGDHGGMGVDTADVVVLVDEDWSGREELVLEALAARCRLRRKILNLEPCRFLRLVAKDSCESRLLERNFGHSTATADSGALEEKGWVSGVDSNGLYRTLEFDSRERGNLHDLYVTRPLNSATFAFPGWSLFSLMGEDLDDVLGTFDHQSRPFFPRDNSMHYCPASDGSSFQLKMNLLGALQRAEQRLSFIHSRLPTSSSVFKGIGKQTRCFHTTFKLPCRLFLQYSPGGIQQTAVYAQLPAALSIPEHQSPQNKMREAPSGVDVVVCPTRSEEELTKSVLFYTPCVQFHPMRTNFYSAAFSGSRQESLIYDGNQGSESLVYFPPLFPRMRECGILAERDVAALRSQIYPTFALAGDTNGYLNQTTGATADIGVQRVITEDEASRSDAASVLIDISDDFGLAGMGAVPLPRDSALEAKNQTLNCLHQQPNNPLPNDWAEFQELGGTDSALDSVLLLSSRKRHRPFVQSMNQHMHRGSFNGSTNAISTMGLDLASKKLKQGPPQTSRPSISGGSVSSPSPSRDLHLHRLLANLRQYGRGSMFEAPIYRVASARIRKNISDRLVAHAWNGAALEAGPGLPLILSKQQHPASAAGYRGMFEADPTLWTSIVKRLSTKDAITGGESVELSAGQRTSLRRSLVSPCRVDFGPFQSGFFSSTTGATVGAPQRPRVGVSLPMGVKISASSKDQMPLPWTPDDDRRLHEAAVRTGMNWILVASELSGIKDISVSSKSESRSYHCSRSARTCRDRWQRLARNNPGMVLKIRQSERYTVGASVIPDAEDVSGERLESSSRSLLIRSQLRKREPCGNKPRTFHSVRTAKVRRQSALPLQIPNVTAGAQQTTSPPHPSHEQAIKTSVAASWTGGRTDMWPLHLLDAADRADSASRHSASSSRTEPASNRR